MSVETKQMEPGLSVVTVSGRLTLGREVERLEAVVEELVQQGQKKFVLDASTLDYADSAGIGTLVACLTKVKKSGGEMRMAGANQRVQRLLQMTGVDQLLPMHASVAEAGAGMP
jgi:anti-sigma B factor antagonist